MGYFSPTYTFLVSDGHNRWDFRVFLILSLEVLNFSFSFRFSFLHYRVAAPTREFIPLRNKATLVCVNPLVNLQAVRACRENRRPASSRMEH